jgi:hypothetical protein
MILVIYQICHIPGIFRVFHGVHGESLPSHRNLEKMVGKLMKTCHTAGHK